jgi:WD40 repeat protein
MTLNKEGQVSEWNGRDFQQNSRLFKIATAFPAQYSKCLFSADASALAVGSINGVLQVWDIPHRNLKRQWPESAGELRPEAFLAAGTKLVTTSMADGLLHEWDLGSDRPIQSWRWPAEFTSLSISTDDQYCLAFGYGGDFVLRTLTDKTDRRLPLAAVEATAGSFSSDGSLFVIASDMGYARVWNTASWQEVATLGGVLMGMNSANFSADGKRLVIASNGLEAVKLFDTESWQEEFTLGALGTGGQGFNGTKFSPDGNSILWGNNAGDLYIWRAPSWEEIAAAEAREKAEEQPRP